MTCAALPTDAQIARLSLCDPYERAVREDALRECGRSVRWSVDLDGDGYGYGNGNSNGYGYGNGNGNGNGDGDGNGDGNSYGNSYGDGNSYGNGYGYGYGNGNGNGNGDGNGDGNSSFQSEERKNVSDEIRIVCADGRWTLVGYWSLDGDDVVLTQSLCIEWWGTQGVGLQALTAGPRRVGDPGNHTRLSAVAVTNVIPRLRVQRSFAVDAAAWAPILAAATPKAAKAL